jgi:hypothetical protein
VEDKREEVLSRNPDLERKLLEAELDWLGFKNSPESIMLRLAEEEARRVMIGIGGLNLRL